MPPSGLAPPHRGDLTARFAVGGGDDLLKLAPVEAAELLDHPKIKARLGVGHAKWGRMGQSPPPKIIPPKSLKETGRFRVRNVGRHFLQNNAADCCANH